MKYFYADATNQSVGPHTAEELAQFLRENKINSNTYIIAEGATEWKTYASTFPPVQEAHAQVVPTKIVTPVMAVLWFLCCFPIGFMQFGQTAKGWCWFLITFISGGIGVIPALIDYWMCYSAHKQRMLKEWDFFPRQ